MKNFFINVGRFFRRNWVWSLCLVLVLALLVWFVGPLLAVNDHRFWASSSSRLLTISLLFLTWGLTMVFVSWRANVRKKADEEDEDYQERQQREELLIEEHLALHSRFRDALRTLRRSSLYSGHSDRRRRELPWYLVLGPEGAGKTSLLDFSGLEFPLNKGDKQRLTRDVSSTHYADWYFAEHAILIDTAGRYLTHDNPQVDAAGWQSLLGLLRKRRPRPLNGILITIPAGMLMQGSELELETLARQTRQRLHDINQRLGADVPVYLVISKADELAGFNEFFDQMSREESDQVLGVSFRKGQNSTDVQVVRQEFEELMHRLNSQVVMRMHQERDTQRRGRILDFPLRLGQIEERLGLFIELAFSGNRYQRASQLRGFYLTSAPQVVDSTRVQHGSLGQAPSKARGSLPAFHASHGRFIHNLLSRVIFPESDLAGLDQREVRRINWGQRTLYTAALGCLIILGVVWGNSFSSNHKGLERLQNIGQALNSHKSLLGEEDDALGILQALDISYAANKIFPPQDQVAWTRRGGLYQGEIVAPALHAAYREDLERLLLNRVGLQLEQQIIDNLANRESLLGSLRAYLMLNMEDRRDPVFLQDWMARDWSLRYSGNTEAQQGLNQHFARLLSDDFTAYALDDNLVANARAELRSESLATVVYRMMREQAASLPDYRLAQHMGPQASLLTSNDNIIPGFFTRDGYSQTFMAEGGELVREILRDNWVLGESDELSVADLNRLMVEMEQLYFEDYAERWSDALSRLHIQSLGSADDGAKQLTGLTAASSPLLMLLTQVRENTLLAGMLDSDVSAKDLTGAAQSAGVSLGRKGRLAAMAAEEVQSAAAQSLPANARKNLQRQFEPLHRLLDEQGAPGPELTSTMQALDGLKQQLTTLAQASVPEQAAFKMAKARMEGRRDAINQLRVSSSNLPQPIGAWMENLAEDSWMLVLGDAYTYLNQRYRSELFNSYSNSLGERYPFVTESESDVVLADFREFFREQGTADAFFDSYLKAFVTDNSGAFSLRWVDGRALPLSREFLAQMDKLQTIRRSFFAENPNEPQILFKLEPHSLDSSLGRASFRFGAQSMEYRHGPIIQTSFRWPADNGEGRTSLTVEDLGGRRVGIEQNTGPWSLFRLLDMMEVAHHSDRDVLMLKANLGGLRANYLLHSQRSPNPFDLSLLRNFSLPARL
ncbi:type VI secretion system membrane subunit TssM [uncultured Halopseudomonas sp.]|uniref:type VI secretion system membrane subunit TssM n=1 Tax=uncultured Halopseudomonas sp. TaxID=2901193 RepID=UPI0030ED294E|tara:strand:- start:4282 stop:7821 length:3540 start_codon:yes stop_codon:yes gene_type:complete